MKDRDIEALMLIHRFVSENGYAISIRELGDAMGVSSPATTWARLKRLERDGLIGFSRNESRTVHLTDIGKCALTTERVFGIMGTA